MVSNRVFQSTFTASQVARAIGCEVRRVQGWRERGILRPEGESKQGVALEYRFGHVVLAGILAEVQALFGTRFQPGEAEIVDLITEQLDPRSAEWVAGLGDPREPVFLVMEVLPGGNRGVSIGRLPHQYLGTALVVNLTRLGLRIANALEAELNKK